MIPLTEIYKIYFFAFLVWLVVVIFEVYYGAEKKDDEEWIIEIK